MHVTFCVTTENTITIYSVDVGLWFHVGTIPFIRAQLEQNQSAQARYYVRGKNIRTKSIPWRVVQKQNPWIPLSIKKAKQYINLQSFKILISSSRTAQVYFALKNIIKTNALEEFEVAIATFNTIPHERIQEYKTEERKSRN